jgi:YD repeat-containing protein
MKITNELLKEIDACMNARIRFKNTKELHDIDVDNLVEIITTDKLLYNDVRWLKENCGCEFKLKKINYNGICYSCEQTYNEDGKPLTDYDSRRGIITYVYNEDGGKVSTIERPDGTFGCISTYNKNGNRIYFKGENGYFEETIYNEKGQKIKYCNVFGNVVEYTYDEKGNNITRVDKHPSDSDILYKFTYDEKGNMLTQEDSNGRIVTHTYDEKENLLTRTDSSNGYHEENTYDENGNKLFFKNSNGIFEEYTYDEDGFMLTCFDGEFTREYANDIKYNLVGFEYK